MIHSTQASADIHAFFASWLSPRLVFGILRLTVDNYRETWLYPPLLLAILQTRAGKRQGYPLMVEGGRSRDALLAMLASYFFFHFQQYLFKGIIIPFYFNQKGIIIPFLGTKKSAIARSSKKWDKTMEITLKCCFSVFLELCKSS